MADMPSDFWSGWIILLTVFSFFGLMWIVLGVYILPKEKINHSEEPVWDGSLREGNNPPPLWWFWLILSAMIFCAAYLMLYPGLGSFSGAFRWSSGGELHINRVLYDAKFSSVNEVITDSSIETLQNRPEVMRAAKKLFSENCAGCHGYEAQGQAELFPNLKDDEWQWGDSAEQIEQTIRHGRKAMMMSWQSTLNDDGVEKVSDYVLTGLGTDAAEDHAGHALYNQLCIGCHGAEGQGNIMMGAPNLANDIWLYGGSKEAVRESISQGRAGEMPAFDSRLDDVQIKMLVAWLKK